MPADGHKYHPYTPGHFRWSSCPLPKALPTRPVPHETGVLRLTPRPSVPDSGRMLRWGWGGWHRHDEHEPPSVESPRACRVTEKDAREGLAFGVPHAALPAAVHELEDPPVLGPDALPCRVARRVEVGQVPETARPRLTE